MISKRYLLKKHASYNVKKILPAITVHSTTAFLNSVFSGKQTNNCTITAFKQASNVKKTCDTLLNVNTFVFVVAQDKGLSQNINFEEQTKERE